MTSKSSVLGMIRDAREHGLTVRELREETGWHHGKASAILSHLHQYGEVQRLHLMRRRCGIYVMPEYVAGRKTVPHSANRSVTEPTDEHMLEVEREKLREAFRAGATAFQRINIDLVDRAFDRWLQAAVDEVDVLGLQDLPPNVVPLQRRES
jgi:DNA-binding transcriptional regulator GbsR (MarR family)